jgi:hypothetical protein
MNTTKRVVAAVAALGLALGGAQAVQAKGLSGRSWVATPNGMVGVQQTVLLKAPKLAGQVATFTFTSPAGTNNSGQATVNSSGFAYLPWTPNAAGTWTLTATSGGTKVDDSTFLVVPMPTTTDLLIQGEVQAGVAVTMVTEVSAIGGVIAPSGTVTVRNSTGGVVATGSLVPGNNQKTSTVSLTWTPSSTGSTLTASYSPNSTAFSASQSLSSSPLVAGAQAISVRLPQRMYLGVPASISSVVSPSSLDNNIGGSQAFNLSIDGFVFYVMGGSQPMNTQGVTTITWTPTQSGIQAINAQYASANFAYNGRDSQIINVQPAPTPDTVTVTPVGAPAWGPGNVGTLTEGSWVEVTPTSTSGNPVTLAADGPCAIEAGTVTALGPGTCTITATSVGNGGNLAAAQSSYTISVVKNTKKK